MKDVNARLLSSELTLQLIGYVNTITHAQRRPFEDSISLVGMGSSRIFSIDLLPLSSLDTLALIYLLNIALACKQNDIRINIFVDESNERHTHIYKLLLSITPDIYIEFN